MTHSSTPVHPKIELLPYSVLQPSASFQVPVYSGQGKGNHDLSAAIFADYDQARTRTERFASEIGKHLIQKYEKIARSLKSTDAAGRGVVSVNDLRGCLQQVPAHAIPNTAQPVVTMVLPSLSSSSLHPQQINRQRPKNICMRESHPHMCACGCGCVRMHAAARRASA